MSFAQSEKSGKLLNFSSFLLFCVMVVLATTLIYSFCKYREAEQLWQEEEVFITQNKKNYFVIFYSEKCNICLNTLKEIQELDNENSIPIYSIAIENQSFSRKGIRTYLFKSLSLKLFSLYRGKLDLMYYINSMGQIVNRKQRDETVREFFFRCGILRDENI